MEQRIDRLLIAVSGIKTDKQSIKTTVEDLRQENCDLKKEVNELKQKINNLERRQEANQVVFHGLSDSDSPNNEAVYGKIVEMVNTDVGVEINNNGIAELRRLGQKTEGRNRPVILKLNSFKTRQELFQASKKLKNTPYAITEYLSGNVMEERKQLIPILIKARSMGKMAYLRQNFIFIENKKHSLQDIKQSQQYHELTTEENTAANEVPATP
ncbi:hypothetical protein JTB14_032642 [Gonioctena quinquepunctata]|nr:hypothetical protein JTB14_032642 [Gonioctena quinquepunctata]